MSDHRYDPELVAKVTEHVHAAEYFSEALNHLSGAIAQLTATLNALVEHITLTDSDVRELFDEIVSSDVPYDAEDESEEDDDQPHRA